jgi:Ca-activated chloride channel family protein
MPGDSVKVTLTYSEELIHERGRYQFVVPAVVGPRYTGESSQPSVFESIPYLNKGDSGSNPVAIHVTVEGGSTINNLTTNGESPTITTTEQGADIRFSSEQFDKDFEVSYGLEQPNISSGLLLHQDRDENFFLLTVQPPRDLHDEMILPRQYEFVLDVSGSMMGYPLETAKKLMNKLLGKLNGHDTFNISFFANGSRRLSPHPLPATPANIQHAISEVDRTSGGGGTELLGALRTVFAESSESSDERSRSIIIITDGYVNVEKEAFELVRQNLGKTNLLSFGIGNSVNRFLIEGLAHVGHGKPFIVSSEDEAEAVVADCIELAQSPVLTDVSLSFSGFEAYAVEPKSVPTLFKNQPLYIYGKWNGEPRGVVEVRGTSAQGPYRAEFELKAAHSLHNPAIRYLWARKRLQLLDDYQQIGSDEEAKATELALKYSLLSNYTSFVAVSERVRNFTGLPPSAVQQPVPLPSGVGGSQVSAPTRALAGDAAADAVGAPFVGYSARANYNDDRVAESEDVILTHINGAFGALIMLICGLLAVLFGIAACVTKRRRLFGIASIAAMVLTVGSFMLRSLVNTWFNISAPL